MSTDIDNKVVSIKFDNSNFESRVSATLASLDKLSKNLKFEGAGKGFDEVSKAAGHMDLSKIGAGVDNISRKFSAMGAVGFSAIQTVTTGILGLVSKLAAKGTDVLEPIITGGKQRAKNIEQAQFMFRGLGIDVEKGMASSLAAVKGTSFGLDEAAKTAAQFGASGIKVGDQMTGALRGVAGAAAMTGSSFSEIGDIFAGAAGAGKVGNQELNQFATRGLNAAAALAKVMHKSEAQVHKMATDGKLDFKTFANAMNEAFGEHATKANETYEGSLANVHAAMSRMGASFIAPRLLQQRDIFNALTPVIDNVTEALKPLFTTILNVRQLMTSSLISKLKGIDLSNLKKSIPNISKGILNSFVAYSKVIETVKKAFRDIFPKSQTSILVSLSKVFLGLTKHLIMSAETANNVRRIFGGVFSIIKIGIHIVTGIFGVFKSLYNVIRFVGDRFNLFGDGVGKLGGHFGDLLRALGLFLVEGGGLERFFGRVTFWVVKAGMAVTKFVAEFIKFASPIVMSAIRSVQAFVRSMKEFVSVNFGHIQKGVDGVRGLVKEIPGLSIGQKILARLQERWGWLIDAIVSGAKFAKRNIHVVGDIFKVLGKLVHWALGVAGDAIHSFGDALGKVFNSKDFNGYLDLLNVGLIAGILLAVKNISRTMKKGLKLDFASDLFGKLEGAADAVTRTFNGLTDTMKAMQTELKAKALKEIAIAIAILTASVLVLSLMDSGALTKSLTAMAVGFGQLVTTMAAMDKLGVNAGKMLGLSTSLILMSGAILILSLAMKVMSTMSPEELTKGLAGVAGGIGILIAATKLIDKNSKGMISAAISMSAMSFALIILAGAVKAFSMMSWTEMGKGLLGVGVGLAILTTAINHMPKGMVAQGVGLILLSVGLKLLAGAVKAFGNLSWKEMGKGLLAMGSALLILTVALRAMPKNMVLIGAGLILISVALKIMASAIKDLGSMNMGDLVQGIGAMAIMLALLAIGAKAMQTALPGAIAIAIIAASLYVLSSVLQVLGKMSIAEIATAIGAIAAVLLVLGLAAIGASYISGPLFILAAALVAIGIGAALFGIGAILIAAAFVMLVKAGQGGIDLFKQLLKVIIEVLPRMAQALADGLINMAIEILKRAPTVIKYLVIVIDKLIMALIKLVPKLGELLGVLFDTLITFLKEKIPALAQLGIDLLISLLTAIRDNIYQVVDTVLEIIVAFVDAITANVPLIIAAAVNLIISFIDGIAAQIDPIIASGVNLIVQFVQGIANAVDRVITAATNIVIQIVTSIAANIYRIVAAGADIIVQLLLGISNSISSVINKGVLILVHFLEGLQQNIQTVVTAGGNFIIKLLEGIGGQVSSVINKGILILGHFMTGLGQNIDSLLHIGGNFITKLITGITGEAGHVFNKGVIVLGKFIAGLAKGTLTLVNTAADVLIAFLNGLTTAITTKAPEITKAATKLADAIIDGIIDGMLATNPMDRLKHGVKHLADKVYEWGMDFIGASSPSKRFMKMGNAITQGLSIGINKDNSPEKASENMAKRTVDSFHNSLNNLSTKMIYLDDISPTISPILDLTRVQTEAQKLNGMMGVSPITPDASFDQARHIAHTTDQTNATEASSSTPPETREIKFEQNIHSPRALSTADIYRSTKSQIALAKEELSI